MGAAPLISIDTSAPRVYICAERQLRKTTMKKSGHKSTLRLLKRLESSSSGGKLRPVAVAFRHRLAFTLLALVQGSGGGGGNENDIGDFIDLLTGQQAAAGVKPEKNGPPTGQPSTSSSSDCGLYEKYKAAVAAKKYSQASALLKTYRDCLKGGDGGSSGKLRSPERP
jgi:hypothetical protein